jgi:hypothetical protein
MVAYVHTPPRVDLLPLAACSWCPAHLRTSAVDFASVGADGRLLRPAAVLRLYIPGWQRTITLNPGLQLEEGGCVSRSAV